MLSEEMHRQHFACLYGSSPLSSTTTSPSQSRSASPARPRPPVPAAPDPSAASSAAETEFKGDSKTRYNKKKSRRLRHATRKAKPANGPARPSMIRKYAVTAAKIESDYGVNEFPVASTGFVALPDDRGQVVSLQDLIEKHGFTLVKNREKSR